MVSLGDDLTKSPVSRIWIHPSPCCCHKTVYTQEEHPAESLWFCHACFNHSTRSYYINIALHFEIIAWSLWDQNHMVTLDQHHIHLFQYCLLKSKSTDCKTVVIQMLNRYVLKYLAILIDQICQSGEYFVYMRFDAEQFIYRRSEFDCHFCRFKASGYLTRPLESRVSGLQLMSFH